MGLAGRLPLSVAAGILAKSRPACAIAFWIGTPAAIGSVLVGRPVRVQAVNVAKKALIFRLESEVSRRPMSHAACMNDWTRKVSVVLPDGWRATCNPTAPAEQDRVDPTDAPFSPRRHEAHPQNGFYRALANALGALRAGLSVHGSRKFRSGSTRQVRAT